MFLPCSLFIQEGFSEVQWEEAKEAVATAKVRFVVLKFGADSAQMQRTVKIITDGLALNKFARNITLFGVPEEMHASVNLKLCHSILAVHV